MNRKLILFICQSLDGYIAPEDGAPWLSIVEKKGEGYGHADFIANCDAYIVGRKTYQRVLDILGQFPNQNNTNALF